MAADGMRAGRTTAIIADDEPRLAEYLKARLAVLWPELVIAGVAANGPDAQALLAREAPDIAFLDIRMPGLTGLEVARSAGPGVHVVFVTAFDQYAVDAFERAAVDYLLKPVTDERLAETVARLKARTQADGGDGAAPDLQAALAAIGRLLPGAPPPERLAWIRASTGQQVRLIAVDDVVYFQANDKYTSVFTADGEALIRTPMKDLCEQLDPTRFWQVHRGTIVNVAHVATTTRELTGRVTLTLKGRTDKVTVSRAYAHLFKQM
jgi:DNA-binding LytR/AlgR family response regulator